MIKKTVRIHLKTVLHRGRQDKTFNIIVGQAENGNDRFNVDQSTMFGLLLIGGHFPITTTASDNEITTNPEPDAIFRQVTFGWNEVQDRKFGLSFGFKFINHLTLMKCYHKNQKQTLLTESPCVPLSYSTSTATN